MPEVKMDMKAMKQGVSNQQSWAWSETNNLDQYPMQIHVKMEECIFEICLHKISAPPEKDRKKRTQIKIERWFLYGNPLNNIQQLGVSENSVPLNPMVNDHYPY